jgi:phage anti-repressor protein
MSTAHSPDALIVVGSTQLSEGSVPTVNARELHAFLRVGKDFSSWIKDRIEAYGFEEGKDFVCSPKLGSKRRGGHNRFDYHLTLDMAKELSMVERNERGKEARRYFIACEKRLREAAGIVAHESVDGMEPNRTAPRAMRAKLIPLVRGLGRKLGIGHGYAWRKVHEHCGVASVKEMTVSQCQEALRWLMEQSGIEHQGDEKSTPEKGLPSLPPANERPGKRHDGKYRDDFDASCSRLVLALSDFKVAFTDVFSRLVETADEPRIEQAADVVLRIDSINHDVFVLMSEARGLRERIKAT